MHQTRSQVSKKLPLPRKGTKFVARALSHVDNSVPVVIAIRDMLKLARTAKEVRVMIQEKTLKINGRDVKDANQSIQLFNIFQADKQYILSLTENGKFFFEESSAKERACKVMNKRTFRGKKFQLNLYDGTNILTTDKINVNDTVYLDFNGKITKHVPMEKGKTCFVITGKQIGKKGKIEEVNDKVKLKFHDTSAILEKKGVIVL